MKKLLAMLIATLLVACGQETGKQTRIVPSPGGVIESRVPSKFEHIFTKEELAFINERKIIRAGGNYRYPPFLYFNDQGEQVGLTRDYVEAIAKITGLRISIQYVSQHASVFSALNEKQIDLVLSIRPAPGRDYLLTTQPYINTRGVFVAKAETRPADIKKLGVIRGSAQAIYVQRSHPNLITVDVPNDEICMGMLKNPVSAVDACMMNIESFMWLSNDLRFGPGELVAHEVPFDFILSFGFHKDNEMLGSILIKALNAMPIEDRKVIDEKWLKEPNRTKLCTLGLFNCNVN